MENIAHYSPGCFATTRADVWVYLAWDESEKKPLKMWVIDIELLRRKIVSGDIAPFKNNVYVDTSKLDRNGKDTGQYAWKIPMDYLESLGVAVEYSTVKTFEKVSKI